MDKILEALPADNEELYVFTSGRHKHIYPKT